MTTMKAHHTALPSLDPRPTTIQRRMLSALLRHKRLCAANSGLDIYHLAAWSSTTVRVADLAVRGLVANLPSADFPFRIEDNDGLWRLVENIDPGPAAATLAPIAPITTATAA